MSKTKNSEVSTTESRELTSYPSAFSVAAFKSKSASLIVKRFKVFTENKKNIYVHTYEIIKTLEGRYMKFPGHCSIYSRGVDSFLNVDGW